MPDETEDKTEFELVTEDCPMCGDQGKWPHPGREDGFEYCKICVKGVEMYKASIQAQDDETH